MRKFIYNFCLLVGTIIGAFGLTPAQTSASASVPVLNDEKLSQEVSVSTLNFSDVIIDNTILSYYYSHGSHSSHHSHYSHRSHRSHYSNIF